MRTPLRLEELEPRSLLSTAGAASFQAVPGVQLLSSASVTNPTPAGYTPAQVNQAYGFNQVSFKDSKGNTVAANGSGQTIAIVDVADDPNIAKDAAVFSTQFGLPQFNSGAGSPTFTKVNENGSAKGPFPVANSAWAGEISLDVEWAHAIAPMANIVLVESSSAYLSDLLKAINTARNWQGVSAVSMSWGLDEGSGVSAYDQYLTTPAGHGGVTFTAATLDNGAYYKGFIDAFWPAVSPNVVAVGGTVLTAVPTGANSYAYGGESGWQYSGGGYSKYETEPSYQVPVAPEGTGKPMRANPDVSYAATTAAGGFAIYDTVPYNRQTGWFLGGGTSAGTPQWASLVAIANQGRALQGLPALDGPSQTLPALYKLGGSSAFHDITSGSNGLYSAGPGYDLVTGLGSPVANYMIQDLMGVSGSGSSVVVAAPALSQGTALQVSGALVRESPLDVTTAPAAAPDAVPVPPVGEAVATTALQGEPTKPSTDGGVNFFALSATQSAAGAEVQTLVLSVQPTTPGVDVARAQMLPASFTTAELGADGPPASFESGEGAGAPPAAGQEGRPSFGEGLVGDLPELSESEELS